MDIQYKIPENHYLLCCYDRQDRKIIILYEILKKIITYLYLLGFQIIILTLRKPKEPRYTRIFLSVEQMLCCLEIIHMILSIIGGFF